MLLQVRPSEKLSQNSNVSTISFGKSTLMIILQISHKSYEKFQFPANRARRKCALMRVCKTEHILIFKVILLQNDNSRGVRLSHVGLIYVDLQESTLSAC